MANYKRKKPKKHLFIDCCRIEAAYDTGNHKWRMPFRDYKHLGIKWRYKNQIMGR